MDRTHAARGAMRMCGLHSSDEQVAEVSFCRFGRILFVLCSAEVFYFPHVPMERLVACHFEPLEEAPLPSNAIVWTSQQYFDGAGTLTSVLTCLPRCNVCKWIYAMGDTVHSGSSDSSFRQ